MGLSPLGISPQVNLEKEISIYFTFKKIARGIFPYCIPECSLFLTTSFSVACGFFCKKQTDIKNSEYFGVLGGVDLLSHFSKVKCDSWT